MGNEFQKSVGSVLDEYRRAVLAKDVEALVQLYAADVCIFDMWTEWSSEGIAPWRAQISQWFGGMGENKDSVEFEGVRVLEDGDVATLHAFIRFRCLSPEGKELRSMQERLTWCLQRKEASWKIVHQHTSAPVDFETFKVIFVP